MTNEEIKELLRDLAAKAEADGQVKSKTVRINFSEPSPAPQPEEDREKKHGETRGREETSEDSVKLAPDADLPDATRVLMPDTQESAPEEQVAADEKPGRLAGLKGLFKRKPRQKNTEDAVSEDETAGEESGAENVSEKSGDGEKTPEADAQETDIGEVTEVTETESPRLRRQRERAERRAALAERKASEDTSRNASVEPADFESDAAAFRSSDRQYEADQAQLDKVRERRDRFFGALASKGFGRMQLIVIAICLVLAAVIGVISYSIVSHNRKIRNVTADEGLKVFVEKEPRKWCSHGEVVLSVQEESPIQTIMVNEEVIPFSGSTKATVSFDCRERDITMLVISEEKVLNAAVTFEHIDSTDPVINVTVSDGLVTLDATDEISGVDAVYYGPLVGLTQIPQYVKYTEPFEPNEELLYCYFAVDKAGNVTDPKPTDLTSAKGMTISAESISLFPAQTYTLTVTPEPANAFINSLEMTSSNDKVISLDENGLITALADGEADVTVSAEGIKSQTCHVTVRSHASVTLSAVGDITLGEDVSFGQTNNFTAAASRYGDSYFFENVRDIFKADDITFGNLEGTLTDQGTRAEKQYAFRGDPSYVNILKDGSIDVVTLANNHSSDYGEISLTDTEKYLDEAGIEYCIGDKTAMVEVNGIKVGLAGIYVLADGLQKQEQTEEVIAALKEAGADIVVVAFHWGNEKESKPDTTQKTLAHAAIDAGADLVVGHHPHVLQGIEKYTGKYICYSLANFCFGGNTNPSDKDTMIFQQTFEIERGGKIQAGDVRVIPCSVSSENNWNNYQPTPATGDEYQRIMDRINSLCEPFKTSF